MPEYLTARTGVAAAFLTLLWLAEGAWPMFPGRERRARHYAGNLGLGLFNVVLLAVATGSALLFLTEYSRIHHLGLIPRLGAPAPIEWALALIAIDAWQYAWHRMNHRFPFLWRFHAVHHTDAEMDASTAVRFHTGELVLSAVARAVVLPLLGISIVQLAAYEAIALPIVMFHHSNVNVPERLDRALRAIIVTPWMHWVHHSDYQPETDSNYASVLSLWDRIFGSLRLRSEPRTLTLGLDGFSEKEWHSLRGMLAVPFRHHFRQRRPAD